MRLHPAIHRPVAVLATVSALALAACGEAPQPPATGGGGVPQVRVITVQAQRLPLTTELPGRVAPALIAEVRPQITGLVLQRRFKEGSDVKAGDVLYQIAPATYRANADAARAELTALTAELEAEIAPVKDLPFVTGHDAYGYLQARFSLNILGSVLLGDASSGGAGHPRELLTAMKDQGAVCIFPESQLDAKPALLLAEGTGVRVGAPIDPSGSTLEVGAGLYAAMMRDLIGAISTCLKG